MVSAWITPAGFSLPAFSGLDAEKADVVATIHLPSKSPQGDVSNKAKKMDDLLSCQAASSSVIER